VLQWKRQKDRKGKVCNEVEPDEIAKEKKKLGKKVSIPKPQCDPWIWI
jgi:hypothetical protein